MPSARKAADRAALYFRDQVPPSSVEQFVRQNYPAGSVLTWLRDVAIDRGRLLSRDWFRANPFRLHLVRPATRGEYGQPERSSYPPALVCCRRLWEFAPSMGIEQIVIEVPPEALVVFRDARDERASRSFFEWASGAWLLRNAVQRHEVVAWVDDSAKLKSLRLNNVPLATVAASTAMKGAAS